MLKANIEPGWVPIFSMLITKIIIMEILYPNELWIVVVVVCIQLPCGESDRFVSDSFPWHYHTKWCLVPVFNNQNWSGPNKPILIGLCIWNACFFIIIIIIYCKFKWGRPINIYRVYIDIIKLYPALVKIVFYFFLSGQTILMHPIKTNPFVFNITLHENLFKMQLAEWRIHQPKKKIVFLMLVLIE